MKHCSSTIVLDSKVLLYTHIVYPVRAWKVFGKERYHDPSPVKQLLLSPLLEQDLLTKQHIHIIINRQPHFVIVANLRYKIWVHTWNEWIDLLKEYPMIHKPLPDSTIVKRRQVLHVCFLHRSIWTCSLFLPLGGHQRRREHYNLRVSITAEKSSSPRPEVLARL